jgi:hypothetical protein
MIYSNMPFADYQRGVIYKLARRDGTGECYIGSTTHIINRRAQHKRCVNNLNQTEPKYIHIRDNGGWDDWCCIVIEQFPCESKTELEIRERHWIDKMKPVLNANKPAGAALAGGLTEYKAEYDVRYRIDNRERIAEQQARYYADHREQWARYYNDNREQILEQQAELVTCECGAIIRKSSIARHRRRAPHQRALDALKRPENTIPTQ